MSIQLIESANISYGRGRDKTKRKSKGLLATTGLGTVGAVIGSKLAQTGMYANVLKKHSPNKKLKLYEKIVGHTTGHFIVDHLRKTPVKELSRKNQKYIKVLNKARLRGGIKGAAIGAGIGLGSTYLINKLKNKDKN